jgi:hypothetical protein
MIYSQKLIFEVLMPSANSKIKHLLSCILTLALCFFANFSSILAEVAYSKGDLFSDLIIVDYWNRRISDRLPVYFNHLLQGGYLNMPSARMGQEGEIGAGYASMPPYYTYNLRFQVLDRLEISGNYRVFKGIDDPILSPLGFGDLSDKGANVKFSIIRPEDSDYVLPGLAFGLEDFMGTSAFKARYFVFTHVFLPQNLEISLGYGWHRIRGFFGGVHWIPFRQNCEYPFLKNLAVVAEYDATPYQDPHIEKHPRGRKKKSAVNFGFKYRFWELLDLSCSRIRGHKWAFSASVNYNFGDTKGFFPKIDNPKVYLAPQNIEPVGSRRPEMALVQDLIYPFRKQGFDLIQMVLSPDCFGQTTLRIHVENRVYRTECDVRTRLNHLLANLAPGNIDHIIVVLEAEGLPLQEYHFAVRFLHDFAAQEIAAAELNVLSPVRDVSFSSPSCSRVIFKQPRNWFNVELLPKIHTFFGSSRGKFKYLFGLNLAFDGYLWDDVYYSVMFGYALASNLGDIQDMDRLNPSQLINVRTDVIRYYQQEGLTVDEAYLQKNWNMGQGWFSRLSTGLFEEAYGGVASEILYYPVNSVWAIGVEAAVLKKRTYRGIGFTDKIRKLHRFTPSYQKFLGKQYFFNVHYDCQDINMDFHIKAGKFLANDWGARFELTRYFNSGLRVSFWYTHTNARDYINCSRYQDRGVAVSIPLDILYTHSDRKRWGYGMSAWLRDIGVFAVTGDSLFETIRESRQR